MGIVISVVLYGLLAAAFCLFVYALFSSVLSVSDRGERGFRILLMLVGATIVLASKSAGVSYADFIVDSVGSIKPVSFGLVGVAVPGAAGGILAWYLGRKAKGDEDVAARILGLIGMLAATEFLVLLGVSLSADGFHTSKALVPNAAFIVGFALYAMLKLDRKVLSTFSQRGDSGRSSGAFGSKRTR